MKKYIRIYSILGLLLSGGMPGHAQDGNFGTVRVKDSITSRIDGTNLILQGKGSGGVEVSDTLHINNRLEISNSAGGENVSIDGASLLEVITGRVFENTGFDGEGLVLVTTADGKAKYTLMKVTTNSGPAILISANTEIGDDTKSITLTPAGGFSNRADNRGPSISGYANQFVDANLKGALHYRAGNLPTGTHDFYTKGYRRFGIKQNGDIKAYGNNLLGIGGSPLSGTVGEYAGAGSHGGLDIIGNGLQETHIQFTRDDQVLTLGARLFDPVTKRGVVANGAYIEIEANDANDGTGNGGNIKMITGEGGKIRVTSFENGFVTVNNGVLGSTDKTNPYTFGSPNTPLYTNGGPISSDGATIASNGGNIRSGKGNIYTGGGFISTNGGDMSTNGGDIRTNGGTIHTGMLSIVPGGTSYYIYAPIEAGDATFDGVIKFNKLKNGVLYAGADGVVSIAEAPPGEKGDKGDKGDQGIQGIQGEQGIQGKKGNRGFTGEPGPQGIQGEQGDQGEPGADGASFTKLKVREGTKYVNLEIVPSAGDYPNNSIFTVVAGEYHANGAKLQLHGNDALSPGNAELHARDDGDLKFFAGGSERVITNKDGDFEVKDHLKLHTERDRRGNFIQKTAEIKGNLVLSNPNYAHAGKFLRVDGSGNVTAVDAPSGGGGFENPYVDGGESTPLYTNGGNIKANKFTATNEVSYIASFYALTGNFYAENGRFYAHNGNFYARNGSFLSYSLRTAPGPIYVNSSGVFTNVNPSDERLKTVKGPYIGGLGIIVQMDPVTFTYNPTFGNDAVSVERIGFLANEVNKFAPELVTEYDHQTGEHEEEQEVDNGDGTKSVRTIKVKETVKRLGFNQPMPSPITVNAVKELSALLKLQGGLIASLEAKNREFEARIVELEKTK